MGWGLPKGDQSPFEPSSPFAASITRLFNVTLVVCAILFAAVTAAIVYSLVAFRHRAGGAEPPQRTGHPALEILWTLGPLATVTWLYVLTLQTMRSSDPPEDRAPDLVVIGHQWWWEARYPSGVVTANEIHIPVGKPMLVRLEAADVVHDFSVPQLTRKMDAVPGHPNRFWLGADRAGAYGGSCAEYCGLQHAWMRPLVVAEPPAAFDAWERAQLAPAAAPVGEAAARGERLFDGQACGVCHAVAGRGFRGGVAPDLTHLVSRSTLGAGVLDYTPKDLAAWLRDAPAIKPGVHMPAYPLGDAQLNDLLAYLEELR